MSYQATRLHEVIGRGSYAFVCRGECRGETVAVKVISLQVTAHARIGFRYPFLEWFLRDAAEHVQQPTHDAAPIVSSATRQTSSSGRSN